MLFHSCEQKTAVCSWCYAMNELTLSIKLTGRSSLPLASLTPKKFQPCDSLFLKSWQVWPSGPLRWWHRWILFPCSAALFRNIETVRDAMLNSKVSQNVHDMWEFDAFTTKCTVPIFLNAVSVFCLILKLIVKLSVTHLV